MSQGKVQQNEGIEGVLFSKDSDKKRQKSTEKKKKKANLLLRPRPLVKCYTMQVTSAGTTHTLKHFAWF